MTLKPSNLLVRRRCCSVAEAYVSMVWHWGSLITAEF